MTDDKRPQLILAPGTPEGDPIAAFAVPLIPEDAEWVDIEVAYEGFLASVDILRVNRGGEVIAARSVDDA